LGIKYHQTAQLRGLGRSLRQLFLEGIARLFLFSSVGAFKALFIDRQRPPVKRLGIRLPVCPTD
jgi:hypothetical protein